MQGIGFVRDRRAAKRMFQVRSIVDTYRLRGGDDARACSHDEGFAPIRK